MSESEAGVRQQGTVAEPPLGEWLVPVFWMSCGALLTALAVGGVVLFQRVAAERELDQLARSLPPALAAPAAAGLPEAGMVTHPVPAAPPAIGPAPPAPVVAVSAAEPAAKAPARLSAERRLAAKPAARAPKSVKREYRRPSLAAKAESAKVRPSRMSPGPRAPGKARRRESPEAYSATFRRCPIPGETGAVECRRHICNGAEGRSAACKPYKGRMR